LRKRERERGVDTEGENRLRALIGSRAMRRWIVFVLDGDEKEVLFAIKVNLDIYAHSLN
jgi:hypothetical protein